MSHEQVRIKCPLRHITVDLHLREHIPLTLKPTLTLLQTRRFPWAIAVMNCNKPVLHIRSRPHLLCWADQDAHLAAPHLAEHLLFLCICGCLVDESHLFFRNPVSDQLFPHIIIESGLGNSEVSIFPLFFIVLFLGFTSLFLHIFWINFQKRESFQS